MLCSTLSTTENKTYDQGLVRPFCHIDVSSNLASVHAIKDVNFPGKKSGYITLENTQFQFIGPDRAPVGIDSD